MDVSDEARAKMCLARIGYYRLSAYWYPFRNSVIHTDPTNMTTRTTVLDDFRPGTSFTDVFDFYVFDKGLRLLVSDALERIEIAFRAQISNLLGARDTWAHRNPKELHGDFTAKSSPRKPNLTKHQDWLITLDNNFKRSREDFAQHFKSKYSQSEPPVWVATEVWDWGMLSHFYDGMKHTDKNAIADLYGNLTGKEFVTWVRVLNDIRNICAHHSRLWNRGLTSQSKLPPMGSVPELDHLNGQTHSIARIYGALVIMRLLMLTINPSSKWHNRLISHLETAPSNPIIGLQSAGFPIGWQNEAIWKR
jgi:abortive infection bacteriophage resistance protein